MPDGRTPEPGGWNRVQLQVADLAVEVKRLRDDAVTRSEIVRRQRTRHRALDR